MKNPKINIIIQARMGSTRLPGKVLQPIMQRPLLGYLIERVRRIQTMHTLIIATTTHSQDDVIASFCEKEKVNIYRGHEHNVLDRYYKTCCEYPADIIVRLTGDCPLIDPAIVDQALNLLLKKSASLDYVSNTQLRTFPRGMDVEAFNFSTLESAHHKATSKFDLEHVTPFIYKHPDLFHLANFVHMRSAANYRLTVDTPEDFLLVSKIFETIYPTNRNFTLADILNVFKTHPQWKKINAHVKQKKV
ncbi:glycosyltransferase family protein [Neochlamydia sp. S13]|uniref:cytidylyltransferase domain-containing protein n=1 Tax=Neochlamydia sp. S13 TaxID=1353976 RepID=UPI0005AA54EE|nr:glycosyltransferase family protein [Neochlamydia sp. S13]